MIKQQALFLSLVGWTFHGCAPDSPTFRENASQAGTSNSGGSLSENGGGGVDSAGSAGAGGSTTGGSAGGSGGPQGGTSALPSWSVIHPNGAPSARTGGGVVWTGTEVLLWGGSRQENDKTILGDGHHYNPESNVWQPMPSEGAPSKRVSFAHVWTGKEFLIWGGGLAGGTYYNDGGKYDPQAKTWTPFPQTSPPKARDGFAFAWTGKMMLVWGGSLDGSVLVNDPGGAYDPSSGDWGPLSLTGAPAGRHAGFVWTGSKAFLWGGVGAYGSTPQPFHGTGALYDPGTDTWQSTTTQGAPSGRLAGVVWAGDVGVVWGGENASGIFNDGGVYNPTAPPNTPKWTTIPSSTCPLKARAGHSMAWTGKEVLIWEVAIRFLKHCYDDGARLDPKTMTCTALPPAPIEEEPTRTHSGSPNEANFSSGGDSAMQSEKA